MQKKRSLLTAFVVNIVVHILYVTGLSVIVPFLFLTFFPGRLWAPVAYARQVIYFSIVLVVVSALILYFYNKSIGQTFFNLGLVTFIPGALALVFSVYNKGIVFGFIKRYFVQFSLFEPYLDTYLSHYLPAALALTVVYVFLGFVFLWIGISYLRREARVSWVKRVFGPSARVLR